MAGFFNKKTNESAPDVVATETFSFRPPVREQEPVLESKKESPGAESKESVPGGHVAPAAVGQVVPLAERVAQPQTKSEKLAGIEKVMSNNLEAIFFSLNPVQQKVVKAEGEKTAKQIELLFEQGKAVAKKILELIRAWLHKIPGVNSFFLEQESKIKTDKILAMTRREK